MPIKKTLKIGIVAGEHSGDRLGAGIIQALKSQNDIELFGVGGPKLAAQGLISEFDFNKLNVMGIIEPLLNFRELNNLRKKLIKLFKEKEVDYFIGVDSPDFNMGIHKSLKNHHSNKNIQVVSPSVWGWRQNRIKAIQANIDLTLCLFNFEDNYYKKVGHNSMHVGHPFADLYKEDYEEVINKYNLNKTKRFISVLPGSRKSEVKNMLPTFIEFINEYSKNNKNYFYLLPVADNELLPFINESFQGLDLPILIRKNAMKDFLSVSELSLATSGTATLESAILECPPVICYKTNFLNYLIISRMLKIENIGLPNLLLSKRYYKELLQNDFNKENILKSVTETKGLISESLENANTLRNMLKGNGYYEATKSISSL